MLLKCFFFISVHAPLSHECFLTRCNKSRRRHAGHITGARTAFQVDVCINTAITSTPSSRAVSQMFMEVQTNVHLDL